ncbi:MAG: hypothetical protein HY686_02405 [Chloroflexi bacterium]|nr:hypothetical protein [Chloroflexota bacterium]
MATLEERTAKVEGILEEIRTRVTSLDNRMTALETRVTTQFYWLLGILLGVLIPMWVSIIITILLRG